MVKLTKNRHIDKYKYSGYGIEFDARGTFLFPNGSLDQNVVSFGAYMRSSVHANNKTKNILILGEGITQGLDDTILTAEKKYSINFTAKATKFCLSIMEVIVICLLMAQRLLNSKQKILES